MTYISVIKEGVRTVHKSWQLVVVQFSSVVLSCVSFFIIVGIPIAIAFIMFGLDLTEILRLKDVVSVFKDSAELLSKYFVMALIIILCLLIYFLFIIVLWIFTISGTIGVLTKNILGGADRFTFRLFFNEGKRLFLPVFMFSSLISIIFIALTFTLGLLGGGAAAIIEAAKTKEATLALFLGVFFSLVLLSVGIFLILIALSITVYGIANLAFKRLRSMETLKDTVKYLYAMPSSIGFYGLLLFGYMTIGFIVILMGSPLTLIPILGPILSLPYQLVAYVIQAYISLVMLSSVFHFYYKTACPSPTPLSIEAPCTSLQTVEEQVPAPGETDESQQS